MCGEHVTIPNRRRSSWGSSPRVRGTPWFTLPSSGCFRDHPRVCGEHGCRCGARFLFRGSSPRVRGTRHDTEPEEVKLGIIPACAGNTMVHASIQWMLSGSSPRVRGTLLTKPLPVLSSRIIPACAGNTRTWLVRIDRAGDHPRVCGEHVSTSFFQPPLLGSSPRVRGTRQARQKPDRPAGIIPACAGNTEWIVHRSRLRWDHPRVCGEHHMILLIIQHPVGSSPRVRGTLVFCELF